MATHNDEEIVLVNGEATQPTPVIGGLIVVMKQLYRCVEVRYADGTETQTGVAELRLRYKREGSDD